MIEAMASESSDEQWADRKLFQLATESRISLEEIQAVPKIGWVGGAEKARTNSSNVVTSSSIRVIRRRSGFATSPLMRTHR